jgi:anaerobic selenocysteine-containing dehydrogenase
MSREERVTWCGLCHARCGLVLELENGRAVAVRGDSEHPANRGRTCRRGRMILEHLYHPDRLERPLRRTGERGGGGWETVSWEQALDDIAHRLDKLRAAHGAETLAFSRGTYRTYHWDARRFLNLFGSPNTTGANPICHCPSVAVESAICGAHPHPDLDHAECIVWWGANRAITGQLSDWPALRAARERGARLITVDPRRTAEAEMADLWLQIRPGTDAALMLAWIHVICEEGLYDRDFVERWTVGFDEVRELASQVSLSEAARLTWVPEEQIVAAARLYATTRPATLRGGQGLEKIGPGFLSAVHAKAILRALTGNLDVVGGDRFGGAEGPSLLVSNLEMELNEALSPAQRAKLLGADAYPLHSFAAWERMVENTAGFPKSYVSATDAAEVVAAHPHAVFSAILSDLPYPVRALICQAANPLLTLADPRRTFAALKALDLLVVMDYYMTPTAAMADYVLPAASTVERDDLAVFGGGCIAYPRGIEPLAERRSDYELWMELGRRLGQAEHWPWDTMTEVCDHRLAPAGLDFEQLKARRAWFEQAVVGRSRELGFATASGKVELRSSMLGDLGCPPLPSFVPPEDTAHSDFPLTLITGNGFDPMYNSEQRQWPTARRAVPDPLLSLHPETAAGLGLAEGDWVRLETATGAVRQRLEISDAIHPQMVDSQQGWWFPEREGEPEEPFGFLDSNVNTLVYDGPEHCSPGTGSWQQTGIPCRVVADPA